MVRETKHSLNQIFLMLILFSLAVIGRVAICQDCFFKSSLYIGHINKTIDNVTCDSWDAHLSRSDPLALKLPDASLSDAANYCRDPDEKGHPWCYVDRDPHHKTWEFCDVLFCRECYFANRSHDYNGYVTASMNGKCLAWTGTSFPDSSFPDGSVARAKNYCRDPDNRGYPHCPTSHGFLPCLIPKCNDSVCADDPSTLCESLKFVICGVKDMAQKLCPKTCGMCGFSLMSPVHIKPPMHNATHAACEDNPMAKCDTLKQFICGNAQAAELCPKTCNLCSGTTHSITTSHSTKTSSITSTSATTIVTSAKPSRGDSGLLCYSCTKVPHPMDCNHIVRCGPTEACSVESFITPSGSTLYSMGCSSQLKCHNAVSLVGRREAMLHAVTKKEDIKICIECCTNGSYCNRELCDTKVNLTGKICMQCNNVVTPKDCATVALCQPGEICYTESKIIHGENRYRLGCVKETSCQLPAASGTITTISPLLDSCGVCCKREIENCNLELCDQHGGSPPKDIAQMYLVDPPIDYNGVYCHDESEIECILVAADRPDLCDNPSIKNHVCPKFCGSCATTIITSTTPSRRECFFRSTVYLGRISTTIDNIICDRWDAHLVPNNPLVSKLPDQRLEDALNYCRDPDDKGHPWCYVKGHPLKTWEFCDVPYCQECYYANQSHMYNGYVSSTNNGVCFNWTRGFPDSSFIDGNIAKAKNYCRDPDHTGYPFCFTSSGFAQCTIPQCKGTCEDDPNTRCEDLKMLLCQSEHFAKLLCPKSCNMCGFGLLEPVHIHPPGPKANSSIGVISMTSTTRTISTQPSIVTQDICVDSVNFSCNNPEISSLICIDEAAATNFCRKTCNVCGKVVAQIAKDQCGDPVRESMCKLLHDEVCLCYDPIIAQVLCPHYCASQCGPVNRNVICPGPAMTIVGRR